MKQQTATTAVLTNSIIEGIREKKGKEIVVIDLSQIDDAICQAMVIAVGNTPTQVAALYDSVEEIVRLRTGEKPLRAHVGSGEWIALDYVDVMVHLFVPDLRTFYNLEQLWADATVTRVPDEA